MGYSTTELSFKKKQKHTKSKKQRAKKQQVTRWDTLSQICLPPKQKSKNQKWLWLWFWEKIIFFRIPKHDRFKSFQEP